MTGWNDMEKYWNGYRQPIILCTQVKFAGLINEITYDQENANLGMRIRRYRGLSTFCCQ